LPCMRCYFSSSDLPPDMTHDQRAEYQRFLASPTATAMALIEAREEIERLHALFESVAKANEDIVERALYTAAESQIAALKVELAAMMKERDEAQKDHEHCDLNADTVMMIRNVTNAAGHSGVPFLIDAVRNVVTERNEALQRAKVKGDAYETCAKERDAALAELGQVRAERDTVHAHVAEACEMLGANRKDVPCDSWKLRELCDATVKRAEALSEENARLKDSDKATREILTKHLRRLWSWCTQEATGPVEAGRVAEWVRSHLAQCLHAVKADFVMGEAAPVDPFGCLSDAERMEQLTKLREENARLRAFTPTADSETWRKAYGQSQALLGRAVAALQTVRRCVVLGADEGPVYCENRECIEAEARPIIDAILADASSTQAVDAWRAQQEERENMRAVLVYCRDALDWEKKFRGNDYVLASKVICHVLGDPAPDVGSTFSTVMEIAKAADARRGGGR